MTCGYRGNLQQHDGNKHLQVYEADIRDAKVLQKLLRGCDTVFHMAAHADMCKTAEKAIVATAKISMNTVSGSGRCDNYAEGFAADAIPPEDGGDDQGVRRCVEGVRKQERAPGDAEAWSKKMKRSPERGGCRMLLCDPASPKGG